MQQQQYILNRLPIGIVMLDRECRVVSYSGTAQAVFGERRLEESLGKSIQSAHPEHSRSKIDWLLEQSRAAGSSGCASMLINVPDTVLQLRVIQLRDAQGPSGYCLIVYDVTELTSQPAPRERPAEDTTTRCLYKLPVSVHGRIALLDIDQVAFLHAQGHYTDVCAGGKHHFCSLSVAQLESRLPADRFVKVHRSYIVNLAHATAVCRRDDQLVLSIAGACAHEIPVSRANATRLRGILGV